LNHLGIITALIPEARCFIRRPVPCQVQRITDGISIIVSGIGLQRVEIATKQILDAGVTSLLVTGTCGALSPGLKPGDIVMPGMVISEINEALDLSSTWYDDAASILQDFPVTIHRQSLISSHRIISRAEDKHRLYNDSQAIAVDMESARVIKLAKFHRVPVLVLRTVIDPTDFTIPEFILKNSGPYGDTSVFSLIKSCLAKPGRLGPLCRLAGFHSKAMKSLILINNRLEQLAKACIPH
jgi:adenosylhomocysteine nucleosidase